MGDDDASVVLLTCTDDAGAPGRARRGVAAWWPYANPAGARPPRCDPGAAQPGSRDPGAGCARTVPARPGRADIDPLLAGPVRRLVVVGTDADLAAVLVRLLRRDRLDVELAYVPAAHRSAAARLWGLPHGAAALDLARDGAARPTPLVRDDSGGVLVGRGEIHGAGGRVHGEAYCDGALVLRGSARRLVVTPWPDAAPTAPPAPAAPGAPAVAEPAPPAVAVRASHRGALPAGRVRPVPPDARTGRGAAVGRAVQVGCLPATVVHDGVVHPRPVTRWAWYRHVADWLLVRP